MVLHDVDGVQDDLGDAVIQERFADRRELHSGVLAGVQVAFAAVEDTCHALLVGKDIDFHVALPFPSALAMPVSCSWRSQGRRDIRLASRGRRFQACAT